jgi:hypothetical protein
MTEAKTLPITSQDEAWFLTVPGVTPEEVQSLKERKVIEVKDDNRN